MRLLPLPPSPSATYPLSLYRTDVNVLMGAPTGSGKTICAELAMLKLFAETNLKVVYIGPLKALVRERIKDWEERFGRQLGKRVLELTGDTTPELHALERADIILTTPEKWDGISRNWQQRQYVQRVGLLVLDEIHLLGVERGAILEVIISRMRYISSQTENPIRFVGLSTALANPEDLAVRLSPSPSSSSPPHSSRTGSASTPPTACSTSTPPSAPSPFASTSRATPASTTAPA